MQDTTTTQPATIVWIPGQRPEGYNPRNAPCAAPGGYGYVTDRGYRYVYSLDKGRRVKEHVAVWEQTHGMEVPQGYEIHHLNGDKLDNRPANLLAVTRLEHARLHAGCTLQEDGSWLRPCRGCEQILPLTPEHWYMDDRGRVGKTHCKPCVRAAASERRQAQRLGLAA